MLSFKIAMVWTNLYVKNIKICFFTKRSKIKVIFKAILDCLSDTLYITKWLPNGLIQMLSILPYGSIGLVYCHALSLKHQWRRIHYQDYNDLRILNCEMPNFELTVLVLFVVMANIIVMVAEVRAEVKANIKSNSKLGNI